MSKIETVKWKFLKVVAELLGVDAEQLEFVDAFEAEKGRYWITYELRLGNLKVDVSGNSIDENGNGEIHVIVKPVDGKLLSIDDYPTPLSFCMRGWKIGKGYIYGIGACKEGKDE